MWKFCRNLSFIQKMKYIQLRMIMKLLLNTQYLYNQTQQKPVDIKKMPKNSKSEPTNRTVIQIATRLVDDVTDNLFSQITTGHLIVDEQERPLEINMNSIMNSSTKDQGLLKNKSRSKINVVMQMKSIDLDQHKKIVRKFMSQNRKFRENRQMRSVEMSQRSIKVREQEEKQRELSKNKALEQRRKSIEQRLQAKRNLLKQIQKSTLESNSALSSVRKRKFLYQQKQEQYYKKVILPKIEQEKQILQAKKNRLRKPIDMNQILEHQKSYEQLRVNSKINRSLTISVIKSNQQKYHPPEFVPESYKKAKEDEERDRLERQIKEKEAKYNEMRKKQFMKKIDEARQRDRQLRQQLEKSRPESPKKQQSKQRAKPQLNREQQKNVGNEYLRQLLLNNRKNLTTKKLKPMSQTITMEPPSIPHHKSQYEIEIIKQERIERVHKIRARKIHDIMTDRHLDEHTRREKLKHEMEKLETAAEQKMNEAKDIETANESALIMMNAIQAKMALLGVDVTKDK